MLENDTLGEASFGLFGFDTIADTNAHTGDWMAILTTEPTVFSTLTANDSTTTAYTSVTVPAWTWLYGYFKEITLISGRLAAYKKRTM